MSAAPKENAGSASGTEAPTASFETDQEGTEELGRYVYCIIRTREDREFGPIGIGDDGSLVYTLRHGDLGAVVSKVPLRIYDPTRANVLAHELVNNTVMEEFTVIPMSFGTMFRTDDDILALLRSTSDALEDVLRKMENKIELGLKVLWDRDRIVELLADEHEEIQRLRDEAAGEGQGSTYFARMQLDRLLERAMEEKAGEYVSDIYETLVPLAVASRSNKVIGESMIMNVAFLVERQREDDFDAAVKEVAARYPGLLTFSYTGPWPPYNFVNIKLRLERAEG